MPAPLPFLVGEVFRDEDREEAVEGEGEGNGVKTEINSSSALLGFCAEIENASIESESDKVENCGELGFRPREGEADCRADRFSASWSKSDAIEPEIRKNWFKSSTGQKKIQIFRKPFIPFAAVRIYYC